MSCCVLSGKWLVDVLIGIEADTLWSAVAHMVYQGICPAINAKNIPVSTEPNDLRNGVYRHAIPVKTQ